MGTDGRVRAFLALDPDPATRARLVEVLPQIEGEVPGVRWVRPEGIHLTLRFLGETTAEILESLSALVSKEAPLCQAFEAPLLGPIVFPRGRPRIVAVETEFPETALALQRSLEDSARASGFAKEERHFLPHLTLGRFVKPGRRVEVRRRPLGTVLFSSVVLFESRLGRGGSVYSPLRTFALGTA